MNKTKEICVLGGIWFSLSYMVVLLKSLCAEEINNDFLRSIAGSLENLSTLLEITFIILIFACIYKKQGLMFLQNFINRFPKICTYLYYIGYIGFILLLIDILVLLPTEFISLNEDVQKFIGLSIAGINVVGILIALVLASRKVFGHAADKVKNMFYNEEEI